MPMPTDLVFRKTEKGVLELRHRAHGLNARVRQVLILLDGHRRVGDLCRMLPEPELTEHLGTLEKQGFVSLDQASSAGQPVTAAVPIAGSQQSTGAPGSAAAAAFAGPLEHEPAQPVPRLPWQGGREPLPNLRARIVRALLDATGAGGDDLATRIERCTTTDELRSLVNPAAAIVEAIAGARASARFLERIGAV